MHQQPNAWRIDILKANPSSLRTLARAAKAMLKGMSDTHLSNPYNYTCVRVPKWVDRRYSSSILTILGQEFAWHNYGDIEPNAAFINLHIDDTYKHLIFQGNTMTATRRAAYLTHRKMWLNYIINMAELYAPLD